DRKSGVWGERGDIGGGALFVKKKGKKTRAFLACGPQEGVRTGSDGRGVSEVACARELVWCPRMRRPLSPLVFLFFFSSRRRHTRLVSDWSSDVCSSD